MSRDHPRGVLLPKHKPHVHVVQAYEKDGRAILKRAFNERDFLEKLTGLDELYREGDAALEAVDWDEEGERGEGADDF
ncbi:hypothetical protein AURDEDRAFT_163407 [Auricularia subglabra TFB-10046 SS5]|nr:hypothetical protein AURDEDRAFT_163407 [Auricularia subglabra TFB-10046 SS5]